MIFKYIRRSLYNHSTSDITKTLMIIKYIGHHEVQHEKSKTHTDIYEVVDENEVLAVLKLIYNTNGYF